MGFFGTLTFLPLRYRPYRYLFHQTGTCGKTGSASKSRPHASETWFPAYQSDEAGYATIYTGPFTTMSDSQDALAAIQKSIAPDAFIVTFAPPENDCNVSKIEKKNPESYRPLFAGVSIGTAFLNIGKSEESTLYYDPDEKGLSYGILLGYDINDDFFRPSTISIPDSTITI